MTASMKNEAVLAIIESVSDESSKLLVESISMTPHVTGCYTLVSDLSSPAEQNSVFADGKTTRSRPVTVNEINALACLLDAFAVSEQPRLRCMPLMEAAGWSLDRIAALPTIAILLLLIRPVPPAELSQQLGDSCGVPTVSAEAQRPHLPRSMLQAPIAKVATGRETVADADVVCTQCGAEAVAAELERRRPINLPRWAIRRATISASGWGGGGGVCDNEGALGRDAMSATGAGHSGRISGSPDVEDSVLLGATIVADATGGLSAGCSAHAPPVAAVQCHILTQSQCGPHHLYYNEPELIQQDKQQQQDKPIMNASAPATPPQPLSSDRSGSHSFERYVTLVDGALTRPETPLIFERVAVGGTFDRLHAGHELLLAATALVAKGFVFVGVTADALLVNKTHKELLQPYELRAQEAVSYMQTIRPALQVEAGPLCDPKTPTLAEVDPAMEALVVSVETMPGANAINSGRRARGFRPLTIITVPVIGQQHSKISPAPLSVAAAFSNKLSSSGLRAKEARKPAEAAGCNEQEDTCEVTTC